MSSITTKVFILSAVECWSEGIDHRINLAQSWKSHTNYNWEGESFIMFQRHNITVKSTKSKCGILEACVFIPKDWQKMLPYKSCCSSISRYYCAAKPGVPLRWELVHNGRWVGPRLAKCFSQPCLLCQPYFIKEPNLSDAAHITFER